MKAPKFDYVCPRSLAEALDGLAGGGDVSLLAGGQSLVPALNLRLNSPDTVMDINRIPDLGAIEIRDSQLALGALVRHADVARSERIATATPLLASAIRHVAHPAVRNRGTTCGSLAYADPAAEMPACAVALDATLVLRSLAGTRDVPAREFYLGLYETARRGDEMLVEVRFPTAHSDEIFGFDEVARRHGDFALVGCAIRARFSSNSIRDLDVVIFGSEPRPMLSVAARTIAEGREWSNNLSAEIVDAVAEEMDPMANSQGRPETKRAQARALVERVLARMLKGANARG